MKTLHTIVTALVLGALARQWAPAHDSIVQIYGEMKLYLEENYPAVDLHRMDEAPQSTGVQFLLTDDLGNVQASEDSWLVEKANQLIAAVNTHNPELLDKLKKPS